MRRKEKLKKVRKEAGEEVNYFKIQERENSFLLQQETARSFSINVGAHKTYLNDFFQEWKPLGNVPN